MELQDPNDGTDTRQQPSKYSIPPKHPNQFNPCSNYTVPSQNMNQINPPSSFSAPSHNLSQFNQPIYHIDPITGMYPFHLGQNNAHGFSYHELLNTQIGNTQSCETVKASRKKAKAAPNPNISPPSITKKDWTIEEEVALTEAWLYNSVDADVGNNQKNAAMWARVLEVWKQKMGPDHQKTRNNNSPQCHWFLIRSAISKFIAKYEQLERRPQSGTNTQDLVIKALRLYEDFYGTPFTYLHCWAILIKNPKWCSTMLTKMGVSNKKNNDNGHLPAVDDSSTISEEPITSKGNGSDGNVRPEGRKNCKERKRKLNEEKGVVDALNKLQSTLEKQVDVNQANLDIKEQVMIKEIELKEEAQKQRKEAHLMKMKEQRRQHIMNQDLSLLSPSVRSSYEIMQAQILKEWESDI